jgi:4-hydroxythreonine-4-phosphate dehydrogenase
MDPVRIGVTLGDPRGIGPEVAAAAARMLRESAPHQLVFIGPSGTGAEAAADEFYPVGDWRGGGAAAAGLLAGRALDAAIERALSHDIDALVTAPLDKSALHAAGYDFPGHTEMLAARTGVAEVVMLMVAERTALGGPLRVVLATTHLPLAEVARAVTTERLVAQSRLTAQALQESWKLPAPRLALCALNPHASDGGRFGDEEARIYTPALARLRAENIMVAGPIPADTVFVRAVRGEFDAVIAPYHDVGMAAFKTAAFGHGVNVTLGLPFPRTSPDHGTALDIAGSGRADPTSMLEALQLAARLAAVRRPPVAVEA